MNNKLKKLKRAAADLFESELQSGLEVAMRIDGDSMLPVLAPGQTIFVRPFSASNPTPGDIICRKQASEIVTHRLVEVVQQAYLAKGDNRPWWDPPAGPEDFIGWVAGWEDHQGRRIQAENNRVSQLAARISALEGRIYQAEVASIYARIILRIPRWLVHAGLRATLWIYKTRNTS